MNTAELDRVLWPLLANQNTETEVYIALPTGEWVPLKAAVVRPGKALGLASSDKIVVLYPDLDV